MATTRGQRARSRFLDRGTKDPRSSRLAQWASSRVSTTPVERSVASLIRAAKARLTLSVGSVCDTGSREMWSSPPTPGRPARTTAPRRACAAPGASLNRRVTVSAPPTSVAKR